MKLGTAISLPESCNFGGTSAVRQERRYGQWPVSTPADLGDSRETSAMSAKYDSIGLNYAELRKPDRRIAGIIERALGSAQTVLNVGAGTGSYEPAGRSLIAVEPSREMIRKRSPAAAEAIQASADDLPFD